MQLLYPALFHEEDGGFWVEFPDLEGCCSQGDTVDEVLANASEALSGYCISLLERKIKLPKATAMSEIEKPQDGFASLVKSETSLSDKSVKKTLTLPSWLNDIATEEHLNFSQILKEALISKLELKE